MTRLKFFIISSAIIFILERVLSATVPWPVFIFPIFVVLFVLLNPNNMPVDLLCVTLTAVFFDFFSGFTFGRLIFAILAVFITIYLVKTFFNINGKSPVLLFVLSLIFTLEYLFLLSIFSAKIPLKLIFNTPTLIEISAVSIIMIFIFLKAKLNSTTR